jgi:N-acetylglucosamine malate deacetylase 1
MTSPGRVLVFSPHPDDVELFLGGTLLKHLRHGDTVRVVMMTRGEKGSWLSLFGKARREALMSIRADEVRRRYALTPGLELSQHEFPDRGIRMTDDAVEAIRSELERFVPSLVYVPEPTKELSRYTHPDHLATGAIVEAAFGLTTHRPRRRYYHSRRVTVLEDISEFHESNLMALRCYRSQYRATAAPPFLLHFLERHRRAEAQRYGRQAGVQFAEAFRERKFSSHAE